MNEYGISDLSKKYVWICFIIDWVLPILIKEVYDFWELFNVVLIINNLPSVLIIRDNDFIFVYLDFGNDVLLGILYVISIILYFDLLFIFHLIRIRLDESTLFS